MKKKKAAKTTEKTPRKAAEKAPKISKSESRIKTGIENLDRLTEGGFEKNSTNLLVGGSGSGKTILAIQFLMEGMKHGEKVLYVTFEEQKEEFYKNMLKLGLRLEEYEKKGLFMFLEYQPEKVKTMLEEGGGAIENTVVHNKVSRMAIDSITSFALLFDNELKKREAALTLFNMIANWNCTSLLTYEGDPLRDEGIDHKALEFEADSVILLYQVLSKGQRENYLEVLKMRGTKHATQIYRFTIGKNGIMLDKSPYKGDIHK